MPSMPDGFPSLSELKTDKFDYSTNRGKVTVTADLEDPVRLLGEGMTLHDVQMTFRYNKNIPGGRWRFKAEGEFMHHSNVTKLSSVFFSSILSICLIIGKLVQHAPRSQAIHLKVNRSKTKNGNCDRGPGQLFAMRWAYRYYCQKIDVGNLYYVSGEVVFQIIFVTHRRGHSTRSTNPFDLASITGSSPTIINHMAFLSSASINILLVTCSVFTGVFPPLTPGVNFSSSF